MRNELGDYQDALVDLDKAIALNPNYAAAYANKARALAGLRRHDDALAAYDKTLALDPGLTEARLGRGSVLAQLERYDDAFAAYRQALALNPEIADAYSGIGTTLRDLGRLDETREAYLKAIALKPGCGEFYYHYANIRMAAAVDPQLRAMETLAVDRAATPVDRIYVHFALGKAYADIGEHERAFAHWRSGNALKRQCAQAATDRSRRNSGGGPVCADRRNLHARLARSQVRHGADLPAGMPRSGTTLVEQILACHSQAHGAGEFEFLDEILGAAPGADGKVAPYPRYVFDLDGPSIRQLGTRYVAKPTRLAPGAAHVTDKMLDNFFFIGMIHLALPNAYIIHTVRNPVDACLQCFSNLFQDALDFTYDLGELGRYYARYQRLMAHWHRVLPPGPLLDVRYEDVVTDLVVGT